MIDITKRFSGHFQVEFRLGDQGKDDANDIKLVNIEKKMIATMSHIWIFWANVAILYSLTRSGSFELTGAWLTLMFRRSARIRPSGMSIIVFLF